MTRELPLTGMTARPGAVEGRRHRVDQGNRRLLLSRVIEADAPRRIFRSCDTAIENAGASVGCVAPGRQQTQPAYLKTRTSRLIASSDPTVAVYWPNRKFLLDHQIMRNRGFFPAAVTAPLLASALGGCEVRGAPSFEIVGSYFPGWMFCGVIGILAAIVVRVAFVASGLDSVIPLQLFVCSAIGICCGLLTWLLWFGL